MTVQMPLYAVLLTATTAVNLSQESYVQAKVLHFGYKIPGNSVLWWVYEIRNLITAGVRNAHASRLRFHRDKDLYVTDDFLSHVAHNSEGFEVEEILDARYAEKERGFEVLIKWLGLQPVENSWLGTRAEHCGRRTCHIPSLLQEETIRSGKKNGEGV